MIENQMVLHKEVFQGPSNENKLIKISEDLLDFGFGEFMTVSGSKEITVTNKM